MLNIQQVTDAITLYQRQKGFIKKLRGSKHSAILATEMYLQSLQDKEFVSYQDLFVINRFFVIDHPVQAGTAAYKTWYFINYQYFCDLNSLRVAQLAKLQKFLVPLKYAGFATCSQAGYQKFPENFSKSMLAQLDKKSNEEKMREFFNVLSAAYQQTHFTEAGFLALCKLAVEGMLNQDYVNLILQNKQPNLLAEILILMKHRDLLSIENQQLVIDFPHLQALQRIMICLDKLGCLKQENFELISAENHHEWLLALEAMPEDLITPGVWEGLVNLLKNSDERKFQQEIKEYAEMLQQDINMAQMEKVSLVSEEATTVQSLASTSRLFSVSPVSLPSSVPEPLPNPVAKTI